MQWYRLAKSSVTTSWFCGCRPMVIGSSRTGK